MDEAAKKHNDSLMEVGYEVVRQCAEKSLPCFIWGGGAIYHLLGGKLDYRKMSDIEFFLPKKSDKSVQKILLDMGFYAYKTFNNTQNMYKTPRREFYRPNRELTDAEIDHVEHGRKKSIEDVKFQKVELFVDGIRMCWLFKYNELPKTYRESLICPPGFQLALKANPIHPDDFDLKDIQDVSSVVSSSCCGDISPKDTIFKEPYCKEDIEYSVGMEVFELLSKTKYNFPTTVIKNLTETLSYSGLSENGKSTLIEMIEFLKPLEKENKGGSFLSKAKKEKPQRVDAR